MNESEVVKPVVEEIPAPPAPEPIPEKSNQEKLQEFLGRLVGLTDGNRVVFGPLGTNGTSFGVMGNEFFVEMVKEIISIEVDVKINEARAIVKI